MSKPKARSANRPYEKTAGSRKEFLRLDLNENRMPPAPGVLRALRRLNAADLAMYPEWDILQERVAGFHGVKAENVLLANGGDEAIRRVFEAFVAAGDRVVLPAPTFRIYELSARLRQARIRTVLLAEDFTLPLPRVLRALAAKPALLVLVSPNNPTGTVIPSDVLRQILGRAGKTRVLLDEAYGFFCGRDHAAWIYEFPNLVVLNSFSKAFAMAGLRLGYLMAGTQLLQQVQKVALPFAVNVAAVRAGMAALEDIGFARRQAGLLRREQRFLLKGLAGLAVRCQATAANFILARFADVQPVWEKLKASGILSKNLDQEPLLAGCLRITVGRRSDNRALLRALGEILAPQAVLFDMDGVLVDARASYDQAVLRTVASFCGQEPAAEELQDLRLAGGYNNDWLATAALLQARNCRAGFAEIKARFQEIYLGRRNDGLCRQENWQLAGAVLEELAARFSLGIVTGRPRAETRWTLARSGHERFFQVVIGAEDTGAKPKPHPRGIRLALRRLGARRAIYVGDRVDDVLAARAAGIRSIAVLPSAGEESATARQQLLQAGADKIIGDVNEILEALNETGNCQA